jgi:hypothetical protein
MSPLPENRQGCTASTLRSIVITGLRNAKVRSVLEQSRAGPLSQNVVLLLMRGRQTLCQGSVSHSHASFGLGQFGGVDSLTTEESVEETQI